MVTVLAKKVRMDMNENYDGEILDKEMMQMLQDAFCGADHVYAVCMGQSKEAVTKAYGSEEDWKFIREQLGTKWHEDFWYSLLGDGIENVLEQTTDCPYAKVCGLAIRLSDKTKAVWIVIGFLQEKMQADDEIPAGIMTTTEEHYYKSLELLETISRQYFSAKLGELMLRKEFRKSRDSERIMEAELKRSLTMTNIVRMLESEESFTVIVEEILKETCGYLDLTDAELIRKNKEDDTLEIICTYENSKDTESKRIKKEKIGTTEDCPYFTGKPYMISSDTVLKAAFKQFLAKEDIQAVVYLPIEVNGQTEMYLSFCERSKKRNWSMDEIKFLNDVKRIIQSVLTKRIAQNSLASSYASLDAILENMGCGIYVWDPKGNKILYANQSFREFFPTEEKEEELMRILKGGCAYTEYYAADSNRWFDVHSSKIQWVDGRVVVLYTIYEVTDKKLYQQKVERQANNDFLTGLYNRMRCEHDLQHFIKQTKEIGGQGALLYIDLDDFKHINDGLGHQYEDVLLQAISHSLQRIPGIESTCYRMGGDEFIIIVTHSQYNMLKNILEEIRGIFMKPWFLKGGDYYCTMSMGVVCFPTDGDRVDELIRKADIAMYQAKKTGKNRIEYYDETIESTSIKRLDLENKMRSATLDACREFTVFFQPIVGVDGECQGAEALIRWKSEGMGLISPTEFIPLAEYLGLIHPIGDFVLEEACRHLKYWNDMGHPNYQVNVNLSVVQLLQNDIVDKIKKVVEENRIIPNNLVLEVTEGLAVNDMTRMKQILAEIKQLGVRVALDDFGTGYSSLNHIREMPIDIIKIDRCFIIDIGKDEFSESFVKMVAELAATIGVIVCVEGVETKEQYEALSKMRIQQIQGFYYDRPMQAELFEEKYV